MIVPIPADTLLQSSEETAFYSIFRPLLINAPVDESNNRPRKNNLELEVVVVKQLQKDLEKQQQQQKYIWREGFFWKSILFPLCKV